MHIPLSGIRIAAHNLRLAVVSFLQTKDRRHKLHDEEIYNDQKLIITFFTKTVELNINLLVYLPSYNNNMNIVIEHCSMFGSIFLKRLILIE